jgi:hypothetical protein
VFGAEVLYPGTAMRTRQRSNYKCNFAIKNDSVAKKCSVASDEMHDDNSVRHTSALRALLLEGFFAGVLSETIVKRLMGVVLLSLFLFV